VVTLRGLVPTFAMLRQIERAVWSVAGITRIDNQAAGRVNIAASYLTAVSFLCCVQASGTVP
jgi:hypothetical protein